VLLGVAAGGAVAFVLLRVFYRMVLGGASLGDTVLWTWPRLALGGPFSHVVLFGPVTAEGLLAALRSALPFAGLILASGSLIAFFDPRGLIFLVPRLRVGAGMVLAFSIALSTFPFVLEVIKKTRRSAALRGVRPGRLLIVPMMERTLERSVGIARALEIRGLSPQEKLPFAPQDGFADDGVSLHHFGVPDREVNDVSWDIPPGSRWVLSGATGVGKTTVLEALAQILNHPHEVGVEGTVRSSYGKAEVAYLPHDPSSIFLTSRVLDEVALGAILCGNTRAEALEMAREALESWNCEALATRHPGELSAGESLRVALAALTLTSPKLVLLDEPLGPLSAHSRTEVVCQLVKYSLAQGATVIMSDHGNREAGGLDGESVVLGSGGLSQGVFMAPRWELPERALYIKPDPDLVMDVADISVEFGNRRILDQVGIQVRRGETLVIVGDNGCGKSTLLHELASISRGPEPLCALVPHDVGELFVTASVREELELADRVAGANPGFSTLTLKSLAPSMGRGGIGMAVGETHPRDLSWGQQTALAIAIQMARKPTVLALDEPTRGLDSGAAQLLREVLSCVVETGTAVIIATHDYAFTDGGSDRVLSLRGGKLWESPAGVSR